MASNDLASQIAQAKRKPVKKKERKYPYFIDLVISFRRARNARLDEKGRADQREAKRRKKIKLLELKLIKTLRIDFEDLVKKLESGEIEKFNVTVKSDVKVYFTSEIVSDPRYDHLEFLEISAFTYEVKLKEGIL